VLILASKFLFEALIDFVKAFSSVSKEHFKASRFWVTGSTSGLAAATNLAASANASAANWRLFFFEELDVGDRELLFVHVDAVVVRVLPNNLPPASRFAAGALVENGAGVAAGIVEPNKKVLAGGSIGVDAAVSVEVSISGFALVATGMDVLVPVVVPVEVPVVEFSLVATGMDVAVSVEVPVVEFALAATAKGLEKSAPKLKPPTAGADAVELSAGVLWGGAFFDLSLFTAITNSRFSKNDFVDIP
jgi:hypothetical protein